jgi:hypothetical protein
MVKSYQRFMCACCLCLQGVAVQDDSWDLNMTTAYHYQVASRNGILYQKMFIFVNTAVEAQNPTQLVINFNCTYMFTIFRSA